MNRSTSYRLASVGLAAFLSCLAVGRARGAEDARVAVKVEVDAGFGSGFRTGWVPVRLTVTNHSRDPVEVDVWAETRTAQDNKLVYRASKRVALDPMGGGAPKQVWLYLYATQEVDGVLAGATWNGENVSGPTARRGLTHDDSTFRLLFLGRNLGALGALRDNQIRGAQDRWGNPIRATIVQMSDPSMLPDDVLGYQAVDLIIVNGFDISDLTEPKQKAIELWVQDGGGIVIAPKLKGEWLENAFVRRFFYVERKRTLKLAGLADLEKLTRQKMADRLTDLTFFELTGHGFTTLFALRDKEGEPVAPAVMVRRFGFGKAYLMAFDPSSTTFRDWPGTAEFWHKTILEPELKAVWNQRTGRNYSQLASYGQESAPDMRVANVQEYGSWFKALRTVTSFWMIALLVTLYVVLIGPVNYLVLKGLKLRPLMPVTIPVLVLLFTGLIFFLAFVTKGFDSVAETVVFCEFPEGSSQGVTTAVGGFFPANSDNYSFSMPTTVHPYLLAQGESAETQSVPLTEVNYTNRAATTQKVFTNIWELRLAAYQATYDAGGPIVGWGKAESYQVVNNSELPLTNAYLLFRAPSPYGFSSDLRAVPIGDFGPGDSRTFNLTDVSDAARWGSDSYNTVLAWVEGESPETNVQAGGTGARERLPGWRLAKLTTKKLRQMMGRLDGSQPVLLALAQEPYGAITPSVRCRELGIPKAVVAVALGPVELPKKKKSDERDPFGRRSFE